MSAIPNHGNYLKGESAFSPIEPPAWWLHEMWLFDDRLVIFPSAKAPTFILARRAKFSAGEPLHTAVDKATGKPVPQNPDTVFMRNHRLLRVCEILPGVLWDQRIFRKLAAHDIQRLGGANEVATKLDAMDAAKAERIQKDQDSELHARSIDAYRDFKTRIGERISLAKTQGRGTLVKQPVSVLVQKPNPVSLATS